MDAPFFLAASSPRCYFLKMAKLISFSGLPGVGKTTIAKELAREIGAVYLRVDSAEAAMKNSVLNIHPAEDAGYLILAYLAKDNLSVGFDVIVDTVNPAAITRKMWIEAANEAKADLINIEVICSDQNIHRQRVENRIGDIKGMVVPNWEKVMAREFEPWEESCITVDTSKLSASECVVDIVKELRSTGKEPIR